jgi:general secretion pathway protein D
MSALISNPNAVNLAAPNVTTLSGRRAQIQITDVMDIVKGINPLALTPPGIVTTNKNDSALYLTENMSFGTTLDVEPYATKDGFLIYLSVIPKVTSFLGYDGPTTAVTTYVNGKKQTAYLPHPQFHSSQTTNNIAVWDGQTLVLGGLVHEDVSKYKDKVPLLGDLPYFGRLFRSESTKTIRKSVLVFITPTIIDAAGNRIHTDEDMAFANDTFPLQPK